MDWSDGFATKRNVSLNTAAPRRVLPSRCYMGLPTKAGTCCRRPAPRSARQTRLSLGLTVREASLLLFAPLAPSLLVRSSEKVRGNQGGSAHASGWRQEQRLVISGFPGNKTAKIPSRCRPQSPHLAPVHWLIL